MTEPSRAAARHQFKRLMRLALLVSLAMVAIAFAYLWATGAPMQPHLFVAVAIGVVATVMLMAALMGLVFMSSRTGTDTQVGFDSDTPPDR